MTENIHIIYSSFGKAEFYRQSIFSICSLLNYAKNHSFTIHLFSDNTQYIKRWIKHENLHFYELNEEKIKWYKEDINFIHLLKINIIQEVGKKYQGKLIYLDSDSFFFADPFDVFAQVDKENSLMEHKEYPYVALENAKDEMHRKGYELFKNKVFNLIDGEEIIIPVDSYSYCAGVVGIHSDNLFLLDKIKNLTKIIYRQLPIFTAEQWSVAHLLQQHTKVHTTKDVLFHYWMKEGKYDMDLRIKSFLRYKTFVTSQSLLQKKISHLIQNTQFIGCEYDPRILIRLKLRLINIFDRILFRF